MADIKQATTDVIVATVLNLGNKSGEKITYLGSGSQGIGKSELLSGVVNRLKANNLCEALRDTIDANTLKDGEITGFPHLVNIGDPKFKHSEYLRNYDTILKEAEETGNSVIIDLVRKESFALKLMDSYVVQEKKLTFALYEKLSAIKRVQEKIYNNVRKGVTLRDGRTLYIDDDGRVILKDNGVSEVIEEKSEFEKEQLGSLNEFLFGETFPNELKLELIRSKVVPLYFLLIDEINRPSIDVLKEMMNFVLNRQINGYSLPWWVNIISMMNPASLNSAYAVQPMDPAQISRFSLNVIKPRKQDWALYELEKNGSNGKYIHAVLSLDDNMFNYEDPSQEETTEQKPNPRAHSIAAYIDANIENVMMNSEFFTKEEKDPRYIRETKFRLISGLIGKKAAEAILSTIESDRQYVPAEDILTAKAPTISKAVKEKLSAQDTITRSFTIDLVLSYICKTFYSISERAKDPRDEEARKVLYNYASQFDEYVNLLDEQGVANLANRITLRQYKIYDDAGCEVPNKRLLSLLIGCPVLGRDQKGTFQKIIETYQGIRNVNL